MSSNPQDSAQAAGLTTSWISYATILIVGVLSLFSLYLGFRNFDEDLTISIMYLFIGSTGFAAIGYLLFRGKAVTQQKSDLKKKAFVETTLECKACNLKRVRDFMRGDYIFKDDEPCTRCEGKFVVTRINRKKSDEKPQPPSPW